ncbi:MAG: phosphate ABC transporter permease subunit PstC [Bdellovibrionota bacterium]
MRDKAKLIDHLLKHFLFLNMSITVMITIAVVFFLGKESYGFFAEIPLVDFLFGKNWAPLLEPKSFGVLPLVCGTFIILIWSMLLAVPCGILVATFLNEFANNKVHAIIKPTLEILAGIPTVVYGYFALTWVTPFLKNLFPDLQMFNGISAAIVVAIMILPMVSSLCDDAFRSIPENLRSGAYALGATPFEVISRIVIPAAGSRVMAAIALAMSRAIGETMAVTLAAGATPKFGLDPTGSIQTMTAYIVQVSLGDVPADGIEYKTCFAVASLLFLITFTLNIFGSNVSPLKLKSKA